MSREARLERLGLLHLKDSPELDAVLRQQWEEHEADAEAALQAHRAIMRAQGKSPPND